MGNYVHILTSVLAIILGQVVGHVIKFFLIIINKEISLKEICKIFKSDFKLDYKYSLVLLVLFNLLAYFTGYSYQLYIYMILVATLVIVFVVDLKTQLIPDTTQIIILFLGIINIFFNLDKWYLYILGALIGGGIFLTISIIAKIIYKKEGMGFGDVKLMTGLGLVLGFKEILTVSLLSFFIAAIISILLIICRIKKLDSYIPFGPFIVISVIIIMFFKSDIFIQLFYNMCRILGEKTTDILFKIIY